MSRQVMSEIGKMIVEKGLKPGDPLPTEQQLAENFEVSKSSVREAIKMLEALGAVEIRRGLCTVISDTPEQGYQNLLLSQMYINSKKSDELRQFRQIIETAYTICASETATEDDLKEIGQCLESFRAKAKSNSLTAEDDISFHEAILRSTHNSFMISLGVALNSMFYKSIADAIKRYPENALDDHERIYSALIRKDRNELQCAISDSTGRWHEFLETE